MRMRSIFILVPSFSPAGPIKGAIALANALSNHYDVTLCAIKTGPGADAPIEPAVKIVVLADHTASRFKQLHLFRRLLRRAEQDEVGSISFCLSADMINAACGGAAITLSSVRGNLPANYRMDYGLIGLPLGYLHLLGLRFMHAVVAMNEPMARQIEKMTGRIPRIVGNFLDEAPLEAFRTLQAGAAAPSIVFLGSLSHRKQPIELIRALIDPLVPESCTLQIIGDGPLRSQCQAEIERLGLKTRVRMHGALAQPFDVLARTDCLVLPSLSEGTARSALEALYLGVPVVARDIDGNRELIDAGNNGVLFEADSELAEAVASGIALSRRLNPPGAFRSNLLPPHHRQHLNAAAIVDILQDNAKSRSASSTDAMS